MNFMASLKTKALLLAPLLALFATAFAQSPRSMDAAEIQQALKRLTVVGTALYVGAHPDDENTGLLSYLAKGRNVRTVYLSATRGEGGQNLIGSEQGELLGVIRTQELLAARRFDGAEQYFTRAIDFGFSKNSDETLRIWNHDNILSDMVWVIRSLQPDVVMTRFSHTAGGHGNHTSSAILAQEAFEIAGDRSRFPEQLSFVQPWTPRRIVYNTATFAASQLDTAGAIRVDIGEYNPLIGRSYTEIAGISRSMHKSQGTGSGQNRGPQVNFFQYTSGERANTDLFDGVNLTWSRFRNGEKIGMILDEAYRTFKPDNPSTVIPLLLRAFAEMNNLGPQLLVEYKKKELLDVLRACAGLWVDALASDFSGSPGSDVRVTVTAIQRTGFPIILEGLQFPSAKSAVVLNNRLPLNLLLQEAANITIPADAKYSQPYWLNEKSSASSYSISDQRLISMPENGPALVVTVILRFGEVRVSLNVPVRYRWVDQVEGELYRPFEIIPPVAVNLPEKVFVFTDGSEKAVSVVIRSGAQNVSGDVHLELPEGWKSTPVSIPFKFERKGEEMNLSFTVKPGRGSGFGQFRAVAIENGHSVSKGIVTIDYKHIPPQTLFPDAEGRFVKVDLKKKGRRIGYIVGSGDEVPNSLRQVGYTVTLLSDEDLATSNLSGYDAIIAGVRVYNTRSALRAQRTRLFEYVERGGTYIVQYARVQRPATDNIGPYRFVVTNDRVTVETAPMSSLLPNHPVLNAPNKISERDFDGWIQERGLNYADSLDSHYETIFAANDPGESPKKGGLIVAKYGKGYFMYTGLAFFRQLPAGVPGAYRLFVNMISLGKK